MLCYKRKALLRDYIGYEKARSRKIGFVPTMGALHEGHISLIHQSRQQNDITICSIFINPTQFNQKEDFDKYPVTTSLDLKMLIDAGCDVVFLPSTNEIYPENEKENLQRPFASSLFKIFEGAHRPGHFDGVVQIMHILLDLIQPDHLYMGRKDYQQALIIKQLIESEKRKTIIHLCEIIREHDGLAMSSRNRRLNDDEHQAALLISKSLEYIKAHFSEYPKQGLLEKASQILKGSSHIQVEYLEVVDSSKMESVTHPSHGDVVLVAVRIGNTRLIDNISL